MIVIIDNYDSFTYNIYQALACTGADVRVIHHDKIDVAGIRALRPERLVISPGPGGPEDAGVSLAAIHELKGELPILGVCLGHQAIAHAFGGRVVRAPRLMHGKTSPILHDGQGVFQGVPSPFDATRYHSLIVERASVPAALAVTAWTAEGEIMGLRHRHLPIEGVQFHPESILTTHGQALLENFLKC